MRALVCVYFTGILTAFSHCVSAVVGGPQITDAEYAAWARGKNGVLTGHVYRQIPTGRRMQCAVLCSRDALACRSFNYFRDDKICELNNATAASYPHKMTTADGCLYYEKISGKFVFKIIFHISNCNRTLCLIIESGTVVLLYFIRPFSDLLQICIKGTRPILLKEYFLYFFWADITIA